MAIDNIDGYVRVAAAVPEVRVADTDFNMEAVVKAISDAWDAGARIVVTPELGLTGYTCGDLFAQSLLRRKAEQALAETASRLAGRDGLFFVGLPLEVDGTLYNCAAVISSGRVVGIVPKSHIPEYGEYYEKRWFASGYGIPVRRVRIGEWTVPFGVRQLFVCGPVKVGVEICEDLWAPQQPSTAAALAGANVIVNLSASNEVAGKHAYLLDLIRQQSARLRCAYAYSSAGCGESSTDLVFAGNAILAEDGRILAQSPRFTYTPQLSVADADIDFLSHERILTSHFAPHPGDDTEPFLLTTFEAEAMPPSIIAEAPLRQVNPLPFVPSSGDSERCREIASIQVAGLRRRLAQLGGPKSVIGVSGGLDSTLALLVTARAYDSLGLSRKNIIAVTMPGFGTTSRTHSNASLMMEMLGVTSREISISEAAASHLRDLGHDLSTHDATYENAQARERTQVLMDLANMEGGIVIGTGDLSELALGWCTYNGDQMSMYGVNASVPKTLVRHLVAWFADDLGNPELSRVLDDVLHTPVSPELIPASGDADIIAQKTEDLVGPYELHDFYLYNMMRHGFAPSKIYRLAVGAFKDQYSPEVILKWLRVFYRRFFAQQFKRSCMPDGPKVGSVCLSPRGDWRMPSDASRALWLADIDGLTAG